jgi:hypothetical protein
MCLSTMNLKSACRIFIGKSHMNDLLLGEEWDSSQLVYCKIFPKKSTVRFFRTIF